MLLNDFWGSNYYEHPPLTTEILIEAERKLGVKLPEEYINLLKLQNGGYTRGFVFPMSAKTSWSEDHIPFGALFGIVTDSSIKTAQNVLDSDYMAEEWGLPEKQILICGEGHWWITLDYRRDGPPSIAWIDVDHEEDFTVAGSFSEFINKLAPKADVT